MVTATVTRTTLTGCWYTCFTRAHVRTYVNAFLYTKLVVVVEVVVGLNCFCACVCVSHSFSMFSVTIRLA